LKKPKGGIPRREVIEGGRKLSNPSPQEESKSGVNGHKKKERNFLKTKGPLFALGSSKPRGLIIRKPSQRKGAKRNVGKKRVKTSKASPT